MEAGFCINQVVLGYWFAGAGYLMLGSVDSYGDLIVSKLDTNGKGSFFIYPIYYDASFRC